MATGIQITLYFEELCERTALSPEQVIEIVELDIIQPRDRQSRPWQFDARAASMAARAARLHRDLELDWHGVALALELLEQAEELRRENHRLRQRLRRFEHDS